MKPENVEKTVNEIVDYFKRTRFNPAVIHGRRINGDVFYSDIDAKIKSYGSFSTPNQKRLEFIIYSQVCDKLKEANYWVHS
jgi:hypothetical protein